MVPGRGNTSSLTSLSVDLSLAPCLHQFIMKCGGGPPRPCDTHVDCSFSLPDGGWNAEPPTPQVTHQPLPNGKCSCLRYISDPFSCLSFLRLGLTMLSNLLGSSNSPASAPSSQDYRLQQGAQLLQLRKSIYFIVCGVGHIRVHMWRSEDNLEESVLL